MYAQRVILELTATISFQLPGGKYLPDEIIIFDRA